MANSNTNILSSKSRLTSVNFGCSCARDNQKSCPTTKITDAVVQRTTVAKTHLCRCLLYSKYGQPRSWMDNQKLYLVVRRTTIYFSLIQTLRLTHHFSGIHNFSYIWYIFDVDTSHIYMTIVYMMTQNIALLYYAILKILLICYTILFFFFFFGTWYFTSDCNCEQSKRNSQISVT